MVVHECVRESVCACVLLILPNLYTYVCVCVETTREEEVRDNERKTVRNFVCVCV